MRRSASETWIRAESRKIKAVILTVAGVATIYIVIGCLIVAGIGVMMAVSRTRSKDPPVG